MGKRILYNTNEVLSASEIGQYRYCSYAWWLQRYGYKPESPYIDSGKYIHVTLGNTIDSHDVKLHRSRWYKLIGCLVLCIAFFLIFFEVIL